MPARVLGPRAARAAAMLRLVRQFESAGVPLAEFCRRSRVPLGTFLYWRRRAASVRGAAPFVEVEVLPPTGCSAVELSLPGGLMVRLPLDAPEELIRRILRCGGLPC